jgi:murein DD-endopeptidase MepM/ murein hydrolase activator NlpD
LVNKNLKYKLLFIICFISISTNAQLTDREIHNLKGGRVKPDNSYVYHLPFANGNKYFLIQAYNSKMSHKSELSLDFKMKIGSKICAAREGVVTATKEDSNKGGLKDEYYNEGNHIIIQHSDGSIAMYWHLKKGGVLVNIGDTITKDQLIGYSGNTGYTAFPHLHFQVQNKNGGDIATRFITKKGTMYLRPGKYHKAVAY